MGKKQNNKPVELSPNKEEEKMSMEEECEELLKTPQSKDQEAFDSETEKIVSTALPVTKLNKKKKKKKDRSVKNEEVKLSTDVTLTKKRSLEESSSDVKEKLLKTEEKKTMFQRIWSDDDEIVLLDSIIKSRIDPFKEKTVFYEFVKSLIQLEASISQVEAKTRKMRKKYQAKANKEVGTISKAHDRLCFEKSEKIWGTNGIFPLKKSHKDTKPVVLVHGEDEWFENSLLLESVASDGMGEVLVKRGWNLVPLERKQKIQEKLRVVEMQTIKSAMFKKELIHDATNAIYEALN